MKDLRFHSFLIAWMKFRVMKFRVKDQMLNAWECDTVVGVVSWPSCCRWTKKNWLALINAEAFTLLGDNDWLSLMPRHFPFGWEMIGSCFSQWQSINLRMIDSCFSQWQSINLRMIGSCFLQWQPINLRMIGSCWFWMIGCRHFPFGREKQISFGESFFMICAKIGAAEPDTSIFAT